MYFLDFLHECFFLLSPLFRKCMSHKVNFVLISHFSSVVVTVLTEQTVKINIIIGQT